MSTHFFSSGQPRINCGPEIMTVGAEILPDIQNAGPQILFSADTTRFACYTVDALYQWVIAKPIEVGNVQGICSQSNFHGDLSWNKFLNSVLEPLGSIGCTVFLLTVSKWAIVVLVRRDRCSGHAKFAGRYKFTNEMNAGVVKY